MSKVALAFVLLLGTADAATASRRVVALNQEASLDHSVKSAFHLEAGLETSLKAQMHLSFASGEALDRVMKNMTVEKALEVVGEERLGHLPEDVKFMLKGNHRGKLRKGKKATPSGYGAVEGVINMLNNMTDESEKKLDLEQVRCADYETKQLEQIEGTRQDISMYDARAASAKSEVLGASTEILLISGKLPKLKGALKEHNAICARDIASGESQLAIVEGDIKIMTKVVQMAKCDGSFLQVQKCHSDMSLFGEKKPRSRQPVSLVSLQEGTVRDDLDQLQHPYTKKLLEEELDALYRQTNSAPSLMETEALDSRQDPKATNATDDPPKKKAQRKCSIKDNPNCQHMRDKFLQILSGIIDKADSMKRDLIKIHHHCELQTANLEAQIDDHETRLKEQQSILARATKEQNEAEGQSRMKSIELKSLMSDYAKTMAVCRMNIQKFQSEICGLKKIRTEVLKIEGVNVFITDCQLSAWVPEECSVSCGGGSQKLTRKITQFPVGGAPCQPLEMVQPCNDQGCPIDCVMKKWTGWSTCSAKCGGGVKSRNRGIKRESKNSGVPCEETSMAETCNAQSCDKNCVLRKWSRWSPCSKMCGGGLQHRSRGVRKKAIGAGRCPKPNAKGRRLQYKGCNKFRCPPPPKSDKNKFGVTQCVAKLDVVILLDGSGSLAQAGWDASVKAAEMFVRAFDTGDEDAGTKADSRVAVLLFSGPRTWADLALCTNGPKKGQKPPDLKKNCGIEWISESEDKGSHFATDIDGLAKDVKKLKWPAATTLTSVALLTASDELKFGRKDAQSVVIVITDGRPMSPGKTFQAARKVRSRARLMWVPVTQYAPIRDIKRWATRPLRENVVQIGSFATLQKPDTISKLIETMCPKVPMPQGYADKRMLKRQQKKR